jgi:4-amino-4-deoxy-L-arabinose transferase-like glycosyltransferase
MTDCNQTVRGTGVYAISSWVTLSHCAILLLLCGVVFFIHLGSYPFFNKGEPREALVVQSIVGTGEWLFPLRDGEIPSKPPLFHWVGALTSLLWGEVTEATVRFPSALFATLCVFIIYLLGRTLFDPSVALLGAVILLTLVGYTALAIAARVDMTMTFFVTLTLALFYWFHLDSLTGPFWRYGFYLLLGLGALAKGPISIVLSALVIGIYLALKKRWDLVSSYSRHRGVILTMIIGVGWYAMAMIMGGEDFVNRQIIKENLARFFVYGEEGTGHQKPPYYYLPYLLVKALPWSIFLPLIAADWIKEKRFKHDGSLFLLLWVLVVFAFFSVSAGKRVDYLLPIYPALSLIIAQWIWTAEEEKGKMRPHIFQLMGGFFFLTSLSLLIALCGTILGNTGFWPLSIISGLLKPNDQAKFLLIRSFLNESGVPFLGLLVFMALLWMLLSLDLFQARLRAAAVKLALFSLVCWFLAQNSFIPAIAEAKSYGPFVDRVNSWLTGEGKLYIYPVDFDKAPVIFYFGSTVPVFKESPEVLRKRLVSSDDYFIMSENEWGKIHLVDPAVSAPLLRSMGTGAGGDVRLVLVKGTGSAN